MDDHVMQRLRIFSNISYHMLTFPLQKDLSIVPYHQSTIVLE